MVKCAIIGVSGGRAKGLAEAYKHVTGGRLEAISTRNRNNLAAFGDQFKVGARYTDYREMFDRERPDLVHINTPPSVRLEVFQAAEEAGIPAVIVEKPLAIQGEDYLAIRDFAKSAKVKIAINHQLHFHPRRQALHRLVQDGAIGEVRFIEASSGMNLAYQGTHTLQAIGAFNGGADPIDVFGQVAGSAGLAETPRHHYAPDQCVASINYANGVSASLRCGDNAPRATDGPVNVHKRIAVYGSEGSVHWTMHGWETRIGHNVDSGTHRYGDEDILGQAAMTDAMIAWTHHSGAVHPLNLSAALSDFSIILGLYQSALGHAVVPMPVEPQANLIDRLRTILQEEGQDST